MATIDISFEKLKNDLNIKDLTISLLEEILFDFGLEIDSYNSLEDILKIEITAERTDLLSYYGLLRALKSYINVEKYTFPNIKKSNLVVNVLQSARDYGNYTLCLVVKKLSLDDSKIKEIINIQEKIHLTYGRKRKTVAIGVYPLDKIQFPITFCALNPKEIKFTPLGFDKELDGFEIIKKHPAGITYNSLLEGKDKYLCFLDSNNKFLSMPPIINSKDTGKVDFNTKDLFIECTGKSLHKLNHVINIFTALFSDMGGEIYSLEIKYPDNTILSPNNDFNKMVISVDDVKNLIGIDISVEKMKFFLEKMMYDCKIIDNKKIEVIIIGFRTDVLHINDLCDDIARAYTFSKIIPTNAKVVSISERLDESILQE
ncbi:MAG: phenylalanine--tRNA ligase beta subunit-related protein, partial [Candidatus ainarchaeum sp.]|nr:phenylalanine--tRNA ligase beta subunit-related protein [Candidatus ainarchaeum sp.]